MVLAPYSLLLIHKKDDSNCKQISQHLKKWGFEVIPAADGNEALSCIRSRTVDLVVIDSEISDANGIDILTLLRRHYDSKHLPVIMLMSRLGAQEKVSVLESGANDFIAKPALMPVLLARIKTQLSLKRAEEALRESEQRYALAASVANDGLWDWDLIANKVSYSPRWKSMLGWEAHEISNDPNEWFHRIHPDDHDRITAAIAAHINGQSLQFEDEYRMLHRDGNYLWMHCRGAAVRDASGKAFRMIGCQTDLTRGKVVDTLTGLPNRVLFMDRLGRSFERARRPKDKTLALIFIDLDDFKLINDRHGHLIGDQLLVSIAGRLESIVRSSDSVVRLERYHTVARLGGDEFTILLEDISSAEDAIKVAQRIAK